MLMQRFLKDAYDEWKNAPIKKGDDDFIRAAASRHNTTEEMIKMYLDKCDWWTSK